MGVKIWVNRKKLYLSIYLNGQRKRESLGLTLTSDEQQNKEVMRIAELCRSKREIQIVEGKWNLGSKGGDG
jgi:aspartate carbamoyltransferase regulatory subunit